jgi:signal transduction histidine kinase
MDDLSIFDRQGDNVGSMALRLPPGAPRPNVADRPYFQQVKATGRPAVSDVLVSRATGRPVVVVAVPLLGEGEEVMGVAVAAMSVDYLAERLSTVGLRKSQAIFLADPRGTLVFHTLLPPDRWGQLDFSDHLAVRSALQGQALRARDVSSPLGDARLTAAVPTPRYGWVASVSIAADEAVAPLQRALILRLLLFVGVVLLAGLLAVLLSRRILLRPLDLLVQHVVALGHGDLKRRVDLRTGDEMDLVGQAFNQMAAQLQQRSQERETALREALAARRDLEEARQRREQFLSMISHELRSPLTVIVGYTQMLARAASQAQQVNPRIAASLQTQAGRLSRLVGDLSDFSIIEAGRFQVVKGSCDLGKMVRELVDHQQALAPRHQIVLEAPSNPLVGPWDCERLAQALGNLVANAVKYSPEGGQVRVALAVADQQVTVAVRDDGIGISPEEVPLLFQPFSRLEGGRSIKGTGLGLFITRAIVEAHGGLVQVESEQGHGSTFSFTLPLA